MYRSVLKSFVNESDNTLSGASVCYGKSFVLSIYLILNKDAFKADNCCKVLLQMSKSMTKQTK